MICLQTLSERLLYHSISFLYYSSGSSPMEGAIALCLNAISQCSVNICHLYIYISCHYLLGLGLLAVSLRVFDFHPQKLSPENRSSRNQVAARQCFSSTQPIYQHPKWFHFCGTQQNEEYLMTSIFIKIYITSDSLFSLCCSSVSAMRPNV